MIGLNFTWMGMGPLGNFVLDPSMIALWGVPMWIFAGVIVLLLGGLIFDLFYHYYQIGYLRYYILIVGGMIGLIKVINVKKEAQGYAIHIHHYFLALMVLPMLCYQSAIPTLVHAFFCGMHIEGGCHYGYDPIWEPKSSV